MATKKGVRQNFVGMAKTKEPGHLWFDTGCRRCVCGPDDHKRMRDKLRNYGLRPMKTSLQEEFIFGDGETHSSVCSWKYPVFLDNNFCGTIDIAEVEVPCPPLFSLGMAKAWECTTKHSADKSYIHIGKHHKNIYFTDTPYIDIMDIQDLSQSKDKENIPAEMRKAVDGQF